MKKTLLVLSFTLGLANVSNADTKSIFKGEFKDNPSYSECVKAIENGVEVGNRENSNRIFFYKDKLYTIAAGPFVFRCIVGENFD